MEGVLGSGYRGDIAVDDVVLSNGACSGLCCKLNRIKSI
jgi:hypothetical protein